MLRACFIGIWILSCSIILVNDGDHRNSKIRPPAETPNYNFATPVFGVCVAIGGNSEITHYACYLYNGRSYSNKRIVDRETFIKFVSGHWPSIYNPDRINFFELYDIDAGIIKDSVTRKESTYCPSMDSLWKIRFSIYPYRNGKGKGWSNDVTRPSSKQENYLFDRYGVSQIDNEYFLDTTFWKLLQDVRDTSWINYYSSLK